MYKKQKKIISGRIAIATRNVSPLAKLAEEDRPDAKKVKMSKAVYHWCPAAS
ncbi:hypothetical protein QUB70_26240 [Microcoleus sp. A003_D6]